MDITIPMINLKGCFIEYRYNDASDWYICPKQEFSEWIIHLKKYIDVLGNTLTDRIKKEKLNINDLEVSNIILEGFYEMITFEFDNEEDALYFKMKYCS